VFFSVVIPTYNRQPILEKCLRALEQQSFPSTTPVTGYEVIVVDDGSTDGTVDWLEEYATHFPHLQLYEQEHLGPAAARNLGIQKSRGEIIIFIDSDLVVLDQFIHSHAIGLMHGNRLDHKNQPPRCFTYGRVINTANFNHPTQEPYKITDFSAAYFATGNVAIPKHWLETAGLFDSRFQQYGWEDLELGVRLKELGLKLIKCPAAVGYHWHPPFRLEQLPSMIDREVQRGRMGVLFYQKHPTWDVRLMIQMTWIHRILWNLLSLGGWLNEHRMAPFLQWMIDRGQSQLALEVARIFLNWYNVKAVYAAFRESQLSFIGSRTN
jgi:glycosyltransferase involved in cell wall biosynthesis